MNNYNIIISSSIVSVIKVLNVNYVPFLIIFSNNDNIETVTRHPNSQVKTNFLPEHDPATHFSPLSSTCYVMTSEVEASMNKGKLSFLVKSYSEYFH